MEWIRCMVCKETSDGNEEPEACPACGAIRPEFVATLRAEVERLERERDEARAEAAEELAAHDLTREVRQHEIEEHDDLRASVERLTRERDEERAAHEFSRSIVAQAARDNDSLARERDEAREYGQQWEDECGRERGRNVDLDLALEAGAAREAALREALEIAARFCRQESFHLDDEAGAQKIAAALAVPSPAAEALVARVKRMEEGLRRIAIRVWADGAEEIARAALDGGEGTE